MLYLEDYLEMIEHLPQELRDRFTEIREMDLQVQNAMDSLSERMKSYFTNAKKMKQDQREAEFNAIIQDYRKAQEDAEEKVTISGQMYDLVDRYLRRLDQELQKFKMELEADNAGITEVLEQRSLELDNPVPMLITHQPKPDGLKRKLVNTGLSNHSNMGSDTESVVSHSSSYTSLKVSAPPPVPEDIYANAAAVGNTTLAQLIGDKSSSNRVANKASASANFSTTLMQPSYTPERNRDTAASSFQNSFCYSVGQLGAKSNQSIAAAASQAIQATQLQQTSSRNKGLASMIKSTSAPSYSSIQSSLSGFNRELAGSGLASTSAMGASQMIHDPYMYTETNSSGGSVSPLTISAGGVQPTKPKSQRTKKQTAKAAQLAAQGSLYTSTYGSSGGTSLASLLAQPPQEDSYMDQAPTEEAAPVDWAYDPNEPRYCICNQISYGDMVACDNQDCPYEWFHYPCVGITQPPKGKWYCPPCSSLKRKKK